MKIFTTAVSTAFIMVTFTATVTAQDSAQHSSNAIDHSARAAYHTSAGAGKLVSGTVAVPLILAGELGKASGEIGNQLWEEANADPLPIADEIITAGPSPAEAMAGNKQEKQ